MAKIDKEQMKKVIAVASKTPTADSTGYFKKQVVENFKRQGDVRNSFMAEGKRAGFTPEVARSVAEDTQEYKSAKAATDKSSDSVSRQANKGKPGFDENGYVMKKTTTVVVPKKTIGSAIKKAKQ